MENELSVYSKCRKRYSFCYNAFYYINTASSIISAACSVSSLGLFTSGIGSLPAIPLLCVGLGAGVISTGVGIASNKILVKVKKHEVISSLASAKLSSIKITVSKALEDGQISDSEFQKVQTDVEDYKMQKRQIQTKTLDEQAVNAQK